ncbi:sugar phosphate nucleotidyltransferase [Engelhardtia mirabilis]|uniref:Glucose-1-phosphate thymidylyltransferase n=1 Tax=Engelhardtia mirabilis TaxID=2528011 RepID=A0A518BMM4_9BACT|nr:Glucose-1-phosphate thymidylyltransferase [Planctomycetes bacterium Pla133]QDV02566.1 Glucose-1-phosphate thymidylyltransferase [Planctomycetes bacterium Pla86]
MSESPPESAAPAAPSDAPIEGVILAAGKGKRIRPFSERYPKPLLPLLDRPLMVWQIEAMRDLGVREITIVIGHLGHRVVQELGDGSQFGVHLRYVEQDQMLGIAHAVGQLEPHLTRPFLLFLGDIFFETENLGSMLELFERPGVDAVLAVKVESDPAAIRRNFTVDLDEAGMVRRVIEKPRHPRTNLKGCGLYLFDPAIFDSIRHTPRTALRDEYELTDAIQIFIEDGYGVIPAPVVQRDLNLSEPSDLLDLNLHVLEREGHRFFVAPDAKVDPSARLERTVVMAGAVVAAGAHLTECLVLAGERVPAGEHRRVVFASGQVVACD